MTQSEFGALCGCSGRTIQAVELGKLALSERLAVRIALETGISVQWLLEGNPEAPVQAEALSDINAVVTGYTYTDYEVHRTRFEHKPRSPRRATMTGNELAALAMEADGEIDGDAELLRLCENVLDETRKDPQSAVIRWRLKQFLIDIVKTRQPSSPGLQSSNELTRSDSTHRLAARSTRQVRT